MWEMHSFANWPSVLQLRWSFLAPSAAGQARGAAACTLQRKQVRAPVGCCGPCSGRSKPQEPSFLFTGVRNATTSRSRPWKPHKFSSSLCCCLLPSQSAALQLSSSLLCGRHPRRNSSQTSSFFPLCNDHGRSFRVCVHACVCQVNPFRAAVPFSGQTTYNESVLSPHMGVRF